ncbi:MAG: hypothetical protein AB1705_04220 [Verrucomicrobiota bacterium]
MKKQAVALALLGGGLIFLALQTGRWGWPLMWLAADFAILSAAYMAGCHRVFGKRPDGTLPFWSWCVFLPFLAYTYFVWLLILNITREPALNEVSDTLIVGRRLRSNEMPTGLTNYVDLTAEFPEPTSIRTSNGYVNFPILDAGVPAPQALHKMVTSLKPGRTFIHCAQGHGRTGLFALAVLLASRKVSTVEDGLRLLQSARPGIRLNAAQQRCIEGYARLFSQGGVA